MGMDLETLVTALLSAGGVAFLGALFRGLSSLRSGARAREREAVDDLGRWRDDLDNRARMAERDRDFWRLVSAQYAAQMVRQGIQPVPADPVPPSER